MTGQISHSPIHKHTMIKTLYIASWEYNYQYINASHVLAAKQNCTVSYINIVTLSFTSLKKRSTTAETFSGALWSLICTQYHEYIQNTQNSYSSAGDLVSISTSLSWSVLMSYFDPSEQNFDFLIFSAWFWIHAVHLSCLEMSLLFSTH